MPDVNDDNLVSDDRVINQVWISNDGQDPDVWDIGWPAGVGELFKKIAIAGDCATHFLSTEWAARHKIVADRRDIVQGTSA